MPNSLVGTGTTITFGTSGFQAQILSVDWGSIEREAIDTTHMGTTGYKSFIPSKLVDPGEIELEIAFDPDDFPPVDGAAETITVTWPLQSSGSSTPASWNCSGFVTSFEAQAPLEEKMTGNMTIKCSGTISAVDES